MVYKFWGDRVIGGEHLIVSPTDGRLICISMVALGQVKNVKSARSVSVYLAVEGKQFVIGTLSAMKFPQISLNLVIDGAESSNPLEGGHSIYIWNLPFNATVAHVMKEFTKFGPIKHGGVQVKIRKERGHCYGFVEYLSLDSMQNAIKESPITFGGRRVVVKEKKSTIRVGSSGNTMNMFS